MCVEGCSGEYPPMLKISDTHYVACHRFMAEGEVQYYSRSLTAEDLLAEAEQKPTTTEVHHDDK
jgi:peptide/nickel transport system ATP-binding protein